MAVELIGTTIIKPTPSTSTEPKHVPLTIFDRAAFNLHVPVLYAFLPPNPSNDSLKHAPPSTPPPTSPTFTPPSATALSSSSDPVQSLLVRRPRHRSHVAPPRRRRPVHEQLLHFVGQYGSPRDRAPTSAIPRPRGHRGAAEHRVEFNHREVEFRPPVDSFHEATDATATCKVENLKVFFPSDFIARLKALVPERRCSTFEVLLSPLAGHLEGKGLPESQVTKVRVAVNGRARMRPVVPAEFFGNLVLWAHPTATVRELAAEGGGLANAVRIINEAVEGGRPVFRSFIDFGEVECGDMGRRRQRLGACCARISRWTAG
ncbi:hypothetical protein HPP92_019295 [Vanilla planifolia]|uniref:Uncharacterized protein n=1 Tax=Vanilla planifolia TaxID=51239 RepID=A0A835QBM3_VANPL|nr:hypothetical protein HPP92_019295 [Vanilla planifolia]